ncbi:MAG: restriction endonuclease subunit R [Erysipelotrichia bacterium]|nr:restriction endonuclease subunit R [Erysipelotrichia bacterium]
MSPIFYRKLVRDKIPEIIINEGKTPDIRPLEKSQLEYFLRLKLLEEAHELFKVKDRAEFTKEAADVLEVVLALADHYEITFEEIEKTRQKRAASRGAFNNGVYLHAVYAKNEPLPDQSTNDCILNPFVVSTASSPSLLELLTQELHESVECRIASAFLTRGMLNLLKRPFEEFLSRNGFLQILTSTMNTFNDPDDLLHIKKFHPGLDLKVFYPGHGNGKERFVQLPPAFHLKCFLFKKADDRNSLIIGSSNMTAGGLLNNEEWNFFSNSEVNLPFNNGDDRSIYQHACAAWQKYWDHDSVELSEDFLEFYRSHYELHRAQSQTDTVLAPTLATHKPKPRQNQFEALSRLAEKRKNGVTRTAVIAATGLGKTHLAAFDFAQSGLKNVLFVVHRENILSKARQAFREVLGDDGFGELLTGNTSNDERRRIARSDKSVFAMIQTLSRKALLEIFALNRFEYIVFDEFHHSEAKTYRSVLDYFQCKFFLGLTATPERADGRDVLQLCDYDVAYETRLFSAIDQRWLTPFQYFAIYDATDYEQIRWTGTGYDELQLEYALSNDTRAELIVNNLKAYLPYSGKIKALAFCANKGHARYMSNAFNKRGIVSECLLGETDEDERELCIARLQNESDELQVICSVDILGEGVDIPAVSHVLLLRPTESSAVILQQLGRGLRLVPGKEYLVALDFVGNFRNSYITPLVLSGFSSLEQAKPLRNSMRFELPAGCSVDCDNRAQRLWEEDIRRIFTPKGLKARLLDSYAMVREQLGRPPNLIDFLVNPDAADPQEFLKPKTFKSWLRLREVTGDITEFEKNLLGSPGEDFLKYFESELNPTRSYKMVVLKTLLADSERRSSWPISWIAQGFKNYYLHHPGHISDCTDFNGTNSPSEVPLQRFINRLRNMPLKFLSNAPTDYFVFDSAAGIFSLKNEFLSLWNTPEFRSLLCERVEYALALYFYRKNQFACHELQENISTLEPSSSQSD